jgi:hypothetical protein
MSEKSPGLQVRKVLARDGVHTTLWGFSLEDFWTLFGTLMVCLILNLAKIWIAVWMAVAWLWIKKIKARVPDHYISDMVKFFFRKTFFYRAREPDTGIAAYLTSSVR